MNDLRHDPDTLDPVAERTAFMRQWQQVPDGVAPWGRTVMHTEGGITYVNVDPPAEAPDLRTVGEKVAELGEAVAALQDDSGHTAHKLRELTARVEHMERLLHRLLNPGEQEAANDTP